MQALSSATSVREIVEREPDASGLLPYLDTGSAQPPPADVAERIWSLLIRDITPHNAAASPLDADAAVLPLVRFQHMCIVAHSCQINDFCLADIRRATLERWLDQMRQVDAFLAFRAKFMQDYGAQLAEIRQLELEEARLVNKESELLERRVVYGRDESLQEARARVRSNANELKRKIEQSNTAYANLEAERDTLQRGVDEKRQALAAADAELARIREEVAELRPVLARGVETLEADLDAVMQRVDAARRRLADAQARGEAYGFAQDALKAVTANLERLVALKTQMRAAQEQEESVKVRAMPMQRRLDQLTRERDAQSATNLDLKNEQVRLEDSMREARLRADDLRLRLKQAAAELDAMATRDRTVSEQLDAELSATAQQLEQLHEMVRSRQEWLDDLRTAEAASARMEDQLALVRAWAQSRAA